MRPQWVYYKGMRTAVNAGKKRAEKTKEELEEFEKTVKHSELPKDRIEMTTREYTEWQRKKEESRKRELEKKGINGEDYITEGALRKWVEEEGRSYAEVARDYIGEKRELIGMYAKEYGIKSKVVQRKEESEQKNREQKESDEVIE